MSGIVFQISPDGSVQAIESEEEIRAVEAVLRDHEAYNSDEYSEPEAKKLPMDRRSLLIQLQVNVLMCYLLWLTCLEINYSKPRLILQNSFCPGRSMTHCFLKLQFASMS